MKLNASYIQETDDSFEEPSKAKISFINPIKVQRSEQFQPGMLLSSSESTNRKNKKDFLLNSSITPDNMMAIKRIIQRPKAKPNKALQYAIMKSQEATSQRTTINRAGSSLLPMQIARKGHFEIVEEEDDEVVAFGEPKKVLIQERRTYQNKSRSN